MGDMVNLLPALDFQNVIIQKHIMNMLVLPVQNVVVKYSLKKQKKELAPTTILSMLTRLENKNFVSVKREGKTNLYSPVVTQSEYQQQEGKSVLEKLYGNSLKNFVASLYQGKQIHEEDIQELEEFLKELEQKGE